MNSGRITKDLWKIVRPPTKYFLRPLQRKVPVLTEKRGSLPESGSKESLLSGDDRSGSRNLREVPRGFLAVYVGPEMRRFVIPASYLSLPDFRVLMERVAEEFGFEQEGGLRIPCEEDDFEEILLRCFAKHQMIKERKIKFSYEVVVPIACFFKIFMWLVTCHPCKG